MSPRGEVSAAVRCLLPLLLGASINTTSTVGDLDEDEDRGEATGEGMDEDEAAPGRAGAGAEAAAAPATRPVSARSVVRSVVVLRAEGRAVAPAALVMVDTAAGPALRPWAARVAAAICSAVSELEPAAFAKLQWQADVVFADQVSQRSVEFRADKRGRFH